MTPNLMPNLMTGNTADASRSMSAIGTIPVGNGAGSTNPGPTGMGAIAPTIAGGMPVPGTGAIPTTTTAPGIPGANPLPVTPGTVPSALSGSNPNDLSHQLKDVYGKGVGGALDSVITNLGSNDSTYMQAYQKAMAGPNAENLATLNTTLGNAGVSASSSTAAIANADFQSNVSAQEGLQEQQLQQTDEQNLIGLLTGTQSAANKQASTSIWGDIGSVLGGIGSDAAGIGKGIASVAGVL